MINILLLSIILSALLFSASFLFANYVGWLIVGFPVPLIYFFYKSNKNKFKCSYFARFGFLWGLIVYGLHFSWLIVLLLTESNLGALLAFLFYILVVLYSSCTSVVWFCVIGFLSVLIYRLICNRFFANVLIFTICLPACFVLYFFCLDKWMFLFLGRNGGYPFINPLIPLVQYKSFVYLLSYLLVFFNFIEDSRLQINKIDLENKLENKNVFVLSIPESKKEIVFFRLILDEKRAGKNRQEDNALEVAVKIYEKLVELNLDKIVKDYEHICVVSPEGTFPFALNKKLEFVELWSKALPRQAHFLLGSIRIEGDNLFQSVYWINTGRIISFYDKNHRVPFTEKIPRFCKHCKWIKSFFFPNNLFFKKGHIKEYQNSFDILPKVAIIPTICSELFFNSTNQFHKRIAKIDGKYGIICVFIKDSWYVDYFQNVICLAAQLKVELIGNPLLYVAHSKYLSMLPFFVKV